MFPSIPLGITSLPSYFTLLMVGFTLAVLWGHREGPRRGIVDNTVLDCGLLMMIAGLAGARILHVLADGHFWDYVHLCTDPDQVPGLRLLGGAACTTDAQCVGQGLGDFCEAATGQCRQHQDCWRAFKVHYGGWTYYGGFLLAVPTGLWFLRRRKAPIWTVADLGGFAIPFGLVWGRTGCYLAGCCFGGVCESPPGIRFPFRSPAWESHYEAGLVTLRDAVSLPVHPTQLYEAVACALVCAGCFWRWRRGPRFQGEIFFLFMLAYAIFRFAVEFLRADARGAWLGDTLSTSQIVSIPLAGWAIFCLIRGRSFPAGPVAANPEVAP